MTTVIPDVSPSDLVGRFRGTIFRATPDISRGHPSLKADLEASGKLKLGFSDGSEFTVVPGPLESGDAGDDLETWHLFTPDGLALFYGPGPRWELGPASDPR